MLAVHDDRVYYDQGFLKILKSGPLATRTLRILRYPKVIVETESDHPDDDEPVQDGVTSGEDDANGEWSDDGGE